jgi:hypothetical protein
MPWYRAIVMSYCATNKFAATKSKLPRDLVISSEAQEGI